MTKQDLIDNIKDRAGIQYDATLTKKQVEAVLDSLADVVTRELKADGEVSLTGIGKLTVKDKLARKGRNPKTGEEIDIEAKRVPAFTAYKALKDAVA